MSNDAVKERRYYTLYSTVSLAVILFYNETASMVLSTVDSTGM
jgi:hypothetical protein